jgi:hypothetical protein
MDLTPERALNALAMGQGVSKSVTTDHDAAL